MASTLIRSAVQSESTTASVQPITVWTAILMLHLEQGVLGSPADPHRRLRDCTAAPLAWPWARTAAGVSQAKTAYDAHQRIQNSEDPVEVKPAKATIDFGIVKVAERNMTGSGFLTEFEASDELKLFDDDVSLRWGKVGARLNASKLETGYLVYVDDGYLTTVEGYAYGEDWPSEVTSFETYELELETDLGGTA